MSVTVGVNGGFDGAPWLRAHHRYGGWYFSNCQPVIRWRGCPRRVGAPARGHGAEGEEEDAVRREDEGGEAHRLEPHHLETGRWDGRGRWGVHPPLERRAQFGGGGEGRVYMVMSGRPYPEPSAPIVQTSKDKEDSFRNRPMVCQETDGRCCESRRRNSIRGGVGSAVARRGRKDPGPVGWG